VPRPSLRSTLASAGGAVALLGSFLPWLRTGERERTSYELSGIARRLGVATGPLERAVVVGWPIVPFLLLCAVVLLVMRCSIGARVFGLAVAAYVLAVPAIVLGSPVETRFGAIVTVVGASLLVVACLLRERGPA